VQGLLNRMLTLPTIGASSSSSTSNISNVTHNAGDTYLTVELRASDLEEMNTIYDFFNKFKQVKRARG
uniref:hypothetical protein n=1 Tax=Streptococcus sobrinus TaxID=1310 RepID=UPI0005B46A5B